MSAAERNEKIASLYLSGMTLKEIGSLYGITREGVRQILKKQRIDPLSGGARKRAEDRRTIKASIAEEDCMIKHGMNVQRYKSVPPRLKKAFITQRSNAHKRGIEWNLNLNTWLRIWEKSGKLDERGKRRCGYVMSRLGDRGAYSPDNVEIKTLSENFKEYWGCVKSGERKRLAWGAISRERS